jgi:hypothetical protein
MPYLTFSGYQERSIYEPSEIVEFFSRPGRANTFAHWERSLRSRKIDDKLRRRYAVPFGIVSPSTEPDPALVPEAARDWLTAYLDSRLMRARRDPGSETEAGDSDNTQEAQEATREIENAANPDVPAHPELPLAADKAASSGVVKGGPFVVEYLSPGDAWDAIAARRCER